VQQDAKIQSGIFRHVNAGALYLDSCATNEVISLSFLPSTESSGLDITLQQDAPFFFTPSPLR
jgi:hypothetical protein